MRLNFYLIGLTFLFLALSIFLYALNKDLVLTQPVDYFMVQDTIAPVGASLPGQNSITFNNGVYRLTYSEGGNIITQYEIDTNSQNIRDGIFSVKEEISEQETGQQFYPIYEAGTRYKYKDPSIIDPVWPTSFVQQLSPNIEFTHSLSNNVIELNYVETIPSEGVTLNKHYLLSIKGKTLILQVEALNPPPSPFGYYQDFVFASNRIPNPSDIALSYAEFAPITIGGPTNNRYYLTNYFDYTLSNSVQWPWFEDIVYPSTNTYIKTYAPSYQGGISGNYNSISETFYITLSNKIDDVIPKVNRQPSQYRGQMNYKIPLELWSLYFKPVLSPPSESPFKRADTKIVDLLNSYGLEDLFVTLFAWRHLTGSGSCQTSGPINYPAEPSWGTSQEMLDLSRNAKAKGYLFGLYIIYNDMFNTGYWAPENLILERDGNWRNYFSVPDCPPLITPTGAIMPQPFYVKPDKWLHYAQLDVPPIKQNYEVDTVFLDVHTKASFPNLIDYDLGPGITAKSPRAVNQLVHSLINYIKSQINGPVMGEGGSSQSYPSDTLHAGIVDGVEGEGVPRTDGVSNPQSAAQTPVIPDFELKHIKPLMVRFGMGYATRWIAPPTGPGESKIDILTYPWDKYTATQIAFGHGAYLNDQFLYQDFCTPQNSNNCWGSGNGYQGNPTQYEKDLAKNIINLFVKQYYNSKKLQDLYLSQNILEIKYLAPSGNLVELSQAIDQGVDFYNPRIYLKYEDGTEIWINRHQNSANIWAVTASDGKTYYLPSNSWLGINLANDFLEYSALVDNNGNPSASGHRVDYVKSDKYIMVDGRGVQTNFGQDYFGNTITSTYFTVIKPDGWMLYELSDQQFCIGGSCVAPPQPVLINQLNPNSIETSSNPSWVILKAGSGTTFSQSFGIQIKESNNPQWPQNPPLYCFYSPQTGNVGVGTCEYVNYNTVRFKLQTNPLVGSYDVRFVYLADINNPLTSNAVSLVVTSPPICGDNVCNGAETCSSCQGDCGVCPSTPPGGSSGGSSSGSNTYAPPRVVPRAQCDDNLDNDNDGKTDYPADEGCTSKDGNNEIETTVAHQSEDNLPLTGNENESNLIQINVVFWSTIILISISIILTSFLIIKSIKQRNNFY